MTEDSLRDIGYRAGVLKNWDDYRAVYDDLTIKDLVYINTAWHDKLPPQDHHASLEKFREMFSRISEESRVVELGCHQGRLAAHMHARFPLIKKWTGYDINHRAIDGAIQSSVFEGVKLSKWFWEVDLPESNVFVSSHTLEHFNEKQLVRVFRSVKSFDYLLLEIPLRKDWKGYRGSHVLQVSYTDIWILLDPNFEQFYSHRGKKAWVSGWKRKR